MIAKKKNRGGKRRGAYKAKATQIESGSYSGVAIAVFRKENFSMWDNKESCCNFPFFKGLWIVIYGMKAHDILRLKI